VLQGRLLQNLGTELTFPGGICPSLPANRSPVLSSPSPANDGWVLAMTANDDLYSGHFSLPFNFDIFGTIFSAVYVNNNGNISFGTQFTSFPYSGFPLISSKSVVAPFWSDVDTTGGNLGYVWMKVISSNQFAVAWDSVGYFNQQGDKRNTFMVLISDGTDASMGTGNNVCFCYNDMQWTTGDGGTGGFGGTSATVGVNKGDGVHFFQLGRYDGKLSLVSMLLGLQHGA